mmetsp:Transcript_20825/g.30860  ORF Transcript_20825/g.30860 Transcript_20825/m.30860 type:complete len:723 (+) Transcript_20825:23-2191(+)|eukprot:CAMPEP_0171463636 /NCGR_PEP_ID=MMETSP0945-20130129/7238_1 /TAXON_ID=109269 /ORGANISM="Vaucheria litorea, Strain CCMP2940" /LENGTH=722 /DNA_ID=CAMNT_0011990489 /DNA_START=12 /DNA_END=2180 /DNA_ORIENTATION=+
MGNENSSTASASTNYAANDYPGARNRRNNQPPPIVQTAPLTNGINRPPRLITAPGAYSIAGTQKNRNNNDTVSYTITVPRGVKPNHQFPVSAGGVQLMVTCPPNVKPGDRIVVLFSRSTSRTHSNELRYTTTVPPGIRPGDQFSVVINNKQVNVTCPPGARPGAQIRIRLPEAPQNSPVPPHQTFEVTVPYGVQPGQPFALIANGQRVMVHCPYDARPGQKIRFKVPIQLSESELKSFNIKYEQEGWVRCVGTDLKFHWARHENKDEGTGKIDDSNDKMSQGKFMQKSSAFVRRIIAAKSGKTEIEYMKAEEVSLEAAIPQLNINFQTLSKMSTGSFKMKVDWFHTQCESLRVPWEEEHQRIRIRRENLLEDSMMAFHGITTYQMRERFRFEFIHEPGEDAGGIAREWFCLVSEQLFNPNFALFQYSSINQMCMQINPSSGIANAEHLQFFHFAGRLIGKALFEGQLVVAHLARPLYKHLLAWPIMFSDLEHVDKFRHDSLLKMMKMDDVSICQVDFTVTDEILGHHKTVELIPNGDKVQVTNENLSEYMELVLKHRTLNQIKEQLGCFMSGFYEVIPEALLTIFDFQEIELLLCGLPVIDLEDWKENTSYSGLLDSEGNDHQVSIWFWEVLEEFESDQKARVLQFVTGTSGVPSQGFSVLQGNDGNIRKFTINGVNLQQGKFPRAHTCFNRIDLPIYTNKQDLKQHLALAIQLECTGFGLE